MQNRLNELDAEIQRLRATNEKISLNSAAHTPSPGMFDTKQGSPRPGRTTPLTRNREHQPDAPSPSASEGGY